MASNVHDNVLGEKAQVELVDKTSARSDIEKDTNSADVTVSSPNNFFDIYLPR